MAGAGETDKAGTPVWKIVVIVVVTLFILWIVLAFLTQMAISPGS